MKMSRILVLGGTGIISTSVVNKLLEFGHEVTIVNRGVHPDSFGNSVKRIKCDLRGTSENDIRNICCFDYDVLIDFISYTPVQLKKMMFAFGKNCKQYIFISTAVIFDESISITENSPLSNLEWSYARDKFDCEKDLKQESLSNSFKYTIVRPYITYDQTRIPLQFSPLEYFTIVNRMKCGKPIIVFEKDKEVNITYSSDFAIAISDIILNPKAYNNDVNIVGTERITWLQLYQKCERFFGCSADYIFADKNSLIDLDSSNTGLNIEEIKYDKTREMVFDNERVCLLSPNFREYTCIDELYPSIVSHFSEKPLINYAWDARYDYFLLKSKLLNKKQKKKMRFCSCVSFSFRDRVVYFINRHNFLFKLKNILKH